MVSLECATWELTNLLQFITSVYCARWMSQLQGFGFPKLLTRKRRLLSILFRNLRLKPGFHIVVTVVSVVRKKIHRTDRIHSISYNKLYLSFVLYWAFVREVSIKLCLSYEFFFVRQTRQIQRYGNQALQEQMGDTDFSRISGHLDIVSKSLKIWIQYPSTGRFRVFGYNIPTSFPGSTPLSRWRLREDPGTHRYTPREILHKSWSILSRDTQWNFVFATLDQRFQESKMADDVWRFSFNMDSFCVF